MVDSDNPVRLVEDASGDRFLVYSTAKGLRIDIRYAGDTLWMTQAQMAELFGVNVPSISRHISNILGDEELVGEATVSKIETVRMEGDRRVTRSIEHYNLDMVISVGYRVSSKQGTLFRRWATGVLVQFASKGFVVDQPRLREGGQTDRIAELREIIRDLRSDEANLFRELRSICAMCRDYDPASPDAREFYRRTQAKLVHAVTSQTPAEIVASRADATSPNMGLQTWSADEVRKADVRVSKNYLAESEVRELNRLTSIMLEIFEDQLALGRIVVMDDAARLLDSQLQQLGRGVLRTGGRISGDAAQAHAEQQYALFDARRRDARRIAADETIAELAAEAKQLPRADRGRKRPDG